MEYLWRASWQASVLAVVVLVLRWVMGRRLSPGWRGALWMLVLLRLALPALPSSSWSLFNLAQGPSAQMRGEIRWPMETIVVEVAARGTTALAPHKEIDWLVILKGIWLVGAVGLAAWTVFVNVRFARRIGGCQAASAETMSMLAELGERMGARRLPRVGMTDVLETPALFGLFRPRLLLPMDLFVRLSDAEVRFVLLHELAHVRRRDLVVGWICCLLRIVHWFNPMVWVSLACQRADAELACDEMVLVASGSGRRREYGYTLLKLSKQFSPEVPVSAFGMIDGKKQLRHRLLEIAGFGRRAVRWSVVGAMLLVMMGWLGLTDARKLSAQPATEELVTRRYEVQDIVVAMGMRDYDPTHKPATAPDPTDRATKVVSMLKEAVPDEAWSSTIDADHFKTVGITITAMPSTQAEIEKVIEQMRADTVVRVSVEARLLLFDPNKAQKLSFTLPGEGQSEALKPLFISDAQVQELIRLVQSDLPASSITAPRVTLFNHQRGKIVVSTMQAYVADVITSTGPKGDVAYTPQVKSVPQESLQLEACPAVSGDHLTIALGVHIKFSRLVRMDEQRNYRGQKNVTIQIPREFVADLSADTTVKDGQTALFAGGVDKDANQVLVIAIKPTVVKTDPVTAHPEYPRLK